VECKLRCVNFKRVTDPRRALLPAYRITGSANNKPGSSWERRQQTLECWRQVWEHLESQWSRLGKTTSSLGTALVGQQIIDTTYCSSISITDVLSLYSHLCMYVSIELPIYTGYIRTGFRRCLRAIRVTPENDDLLNSEIHSEAVIK
jgi:hypothetical protein